MFSIQGFMTCKSKLPNELRHLSQVKRYQIYSLMKAQHSPTQIAQLLERNKFTTEHGLMAPKHWSNLR